MLSMRIVPAATQLSALEVNEVRKDDPSLHWERCREQHTTPTRNHYSGSPTARTIIGWIIGGCRCLVCNRRFRKEAFFSWGGSRGYFTGTPMRILGTRLQFCALWHDRMPECSDDTTWDFGLALFPTKDQGTTKARGALTQTDGDEERNQTPTSVAIPPQASREICISDYPEILYCAC